MKDIIIEAGQKLGKYLREELDGRVTQLNTKRLNAAATDLLPGERYAHVRFFMELCEKYHLIAKYAESDLERDARAGDIVHTLKDKALMTDDSARCAAALIILICEGTPEAECFAKSLFEPKEAPKPEAPTPVQPKAQPQTQNNQTQTVYPTNNVPPTPKPTTPEAVKGAPLQTNPPKQPTNPQKPNNPSDFYIVDGVLKEYRGRDAHVVVPSGVKGLGAKSFSGCDFLKSVVVPDSVISIASGSFYGCSSLESITLPFIGGGYRKSDPNHNPFGFIFGIRKFDGAAATNQRCYGDYGHSRTVYYIPESLKHVTLTGGKMDRCDFDECYFIESVTFAYENLFDYVPINMFFCCRNLKRVTLPTGVNGFCEGAFAGCYQLEEITFPHGISCIDKHAFANCKSLKNVVLPSGLEVIDESAFKYCDNLESITIPRSVKKIGRDAFAECPKLTIYKEGGLKPWEIFGTGWNPDRRPVKKI